jgi:cytochrome c5
MRNTLKLLVVISLTVLGITQAKHMDPDTIDERTKPVAKVRVAGTEEAKLAMEAAAPKGPRTADAVFNQYCTACHTTGLLNAPKPGSDTWTPIMANGMATVLESAKKGKNAMPAMGNCADCTDEELTNTIKYMVEFGN